MLVPRIAITAGEPAGIGPDILLMIAQDSWPAELVAIADEGMLERRASMLGLPISFRHFDPKRKPTPHRSSDLTILHTRLSEKERLGILNVANAHYVLDTINLAIEGCKFGDFSAMVTGPVQKSIICDADFEFSGHTEFIAKKVGVEHPVMLLITEKLKVALATTHLPLADVPEAITKTGLIETLQTLDSGLKAICHISKPRIGVLALNPHAGENGNLGSEEINIIKPAIDEMLDLGLSLEGPLPADTAFHDKNITRIHAYLAMYHDQGLPVIKFSSFGKAANVTLGLPFVRSSVDHGTALNLAGSGAASPDSLRVALDFAIKHVTY